MGAFELDDDGFLENIFHLRSMEKLKSSHHQAFLKLAITTPLLHPHSSAARCAGKEFNVFVSISLSFIAPDIDFPNGHRTHKPKGSLPPSPADSGVSDVDSSSSGGQPACSDELKARLGIPTSSTGPVSNTGQPSHPHHQQQQQQQQQHQQQQQQQQQHHQQHHQQQPPQHQHPQSQPLSVHPNGGTGSPTGGTTSLSSSSALSQVAAAAVTAQLQQQAAHLQSGPFLRPNFYHHNSPPLRNIWNQRSVPCK
uniref:Uncharacterized protein n=1 Tax=Anopheles culicifacies TaxID=139723 RepID=A0A182ML20_9DIPT